MGTNGNLYKLYYESGGQTHSVTIETIDDMGNDKSTIQTLAQPSSYVVSSGKGKIIDITNDTVNHVTNPKLIRPKSIPHTSVSRAHAPSDTSVRSQIGEMTPVHSLPPELSPPVADPKKPVIGLKWISLNDSEAKSSNNSNNIGSNVSSNSIAVAGGTILDHEPSLASHLVGEMTEKISSPTTCTQPNGVSTKVSSVSYLGTVSTRTTSSAPTSAGIPVPLASKFHPLPNSSQKTQAGGDCIFEVTLFKGATGLGMNLAGGGSHDNPITIKKIASGTAADQCGQLRLGDIILEVNGKSVTLLSAKEVISILRACPSEVQLLAKRPGLQMMQQNMPVTSSNYP